MNTQVTAHQTLLSSARPLGIELLDCVRSRVDELGLRFETPSWEAADLEIVQDASTGEKSVLGCWQGPDEMRVGGWVIQLGGNGFAELEVLCRHPNNPLLFVESVCAFAENGKLRCETKCRSLCPKPDRHPHAQTLSAQAVL